MNKKTLQNYIAEIDRARFRDSAKMLKISRKMMIEAKNGEDDVAGAYGEYFYLEASYRLGILNEKMLNRAIRVLQVCRRCKLYELEVKTDNMIGIFFLNQGDNITALEYYQMAMECASKHHFRSLNRIVLNNIGDLYLKMKQYDVALQHLQKCLEASMEMYEKEKQSGRADIHVININITLMNMAECYYCLEDYAESIEHLESMYELVDDYGDVYYGAAKDALMVINYAKLDRLGEVEHLIENTIRAAEEGDDKIESVDNYIHVCRCLAESDRLEQAERMYSAIRKITEDLNFANLWCDYYETAILIAKKRGDTTELLRAYESYIASKKKMDELQNVQQLNALKNRQALNLALKKQKRAEEAKISLKHLSEHDPLTGLYNRYVLNRECEKWCRAARRKNSTIGVIVMDIDYFKQYNDFYGHLEGDNCIRKISEALIEAVGDKGIVVRYGGDEFFVLMQGMDTDAVMDTAKKINRCIRGKNVLHEKSLVSEYATASQGVVNAVPTEEQSVHDLIQLADNALYRAKEVKRSSIGLYRNGKYKVYSNETVE